MSDGSSLQEASSHLYIVAGYPASGKSSSLWDSARGRVSLFGNDNHSVIPAIEELRDVRENFGTKDKLKSGLWCTLSDVPQLNVEFGLPTRLVLHLDLLLAYLLHRAPGNSIPEPTEMDAAFGRLLAQPALKRYARITITTLYVPLVEIQRRWRHRYPDGVPAKSSMTLIEKHRLITDGGVAAPLFSAIHDGWERCLASLSGSGALASHFHGRTSFPSPLPR